MISFDTMPPRRENLPTEKPNSPSPGKVVHASKHFFCFALAAVSFSAFASSLNAASYYFSPTGNDSNATNSQATPWASITKFNSINFNPGDHIYFQGGATFSGSLQLDSSDVGTSLAPITIGSYGTGDATINSGTAAGLFAYDTGGYNINNLTFQGSGSTNTNEGVSFYNDKLQTVLTGIHLSNLDISGYGQDGVNIGSYNTALPQHDPAATQGWNNISITGVNSHNNLGAGIDIYGQTTSNNTNVYVAHNIAANNGGSGIVVGATNGGTIERNLAHGNGSAHDLSVGIMVYDSNAMTVQYNESYGQTTPGLHDGDGFDFDGGTTNSVMQYNYSHGNGGVGFLLGEYSGSSSTTGNSIRYNISQNDGHQNNYAGLGIYDFNQLGKVTNNFIYNNTFFNNVSGASAVVLWGNLQGSNNQVLNNIFQTAGGVPLINDTTPGGGVTFLNNDYWSTGGTFTIHWGGVDYHSLAAWQLAIGQEISNSKLYGFELNPGLTAPGAGGIIGDPNLLATLSAYRLLSSSSLVNDGLNLFTLLGYGGTDFYGVPVPQGAGFDLGASEVPEPGSLAALITTGFLLLYRRRSQTVSNSSASFRAC